MFRNLMSIAPAVFAAAVLLIAGGCARLDFDQPKQRSFALPDTDGTLLHRETARWVASHGGRSGAYPLKEGLDALGVRLMLANYAEKSIDLQYFLMKDDRAGSIMTEALLRAADRGVRVRFLLDDIFTTAPDHTLLLLDRHPNIEVRLFNPVSRRGFSKLNFLTGFRLANRRMHNKSFTVDNSVSIVGGRNIADEYFQLKNTSDFLDFDVVVLGPVLADISASFDEFWNHRLALPIDLVGRPGRHESLEAVRAAVHEERAAAYDSVYAAALQSTLMQDLLAGRTAFFPADIWVLADEADKLLNRVGLEHIRLASDLEKVLLQAKQEVVMISPYYIPREYGVRSMAELIRKGVRVIIITNSLASNNHVPVHGAYSRYREKMIALGAEIYETRARAVRALHADAEGPDALTLHSKLLLIDRRLVFAGSLNLDPRSIEINAEMGLLIDSEDFAAELMANPDELPELTYRVQLDERGRLEWHGRVDGRPVVETREPEAGLWRRFMATLSKILPERQL